MKEADPAFRLVQYIGYLSQITESAPDEWKQLFKELLGELNQWTKLTAEQLATFQNQTQMIQLLAQTCERLTIALNAQELTLQKHSEVLSELIESLMNLMGDNGEIQNLKELLKETNQALMEIHTELGEKSTLTIELSRTQLMRLSSDLAKIMDYSLKLILKKEREKRQSRLTEIIDNIQNGILALSGSWLLFVTLFSLVTIGLFSSMATLIFLHSFPIPLSNEASTMLEQTKKQIIYANNKLERIEKKLGSEPEPEPKQIKKK